MVAKAQVFMCQWCQSLFLEEQDAKDCEEIHASYDNLEVADSRRFDDIHNEYGEQRFPKHILLSDKRYSGVLAEYHRGSVASMENFYEHEPWSEESNKNVDERMAIKYEDTHSEDDDAD